jgi:LysM repeat protein
VREIRWLLFAIGFALLLVSASYGSLWAFAPTKLVVQSTGQSTGQFTGSSVSIQRPAPPAGWLRQTAISETAAAEVAAAPSLLPTVTPAPQAQASLTATTTVTGTSAPTYYVVLPGDTLFVIARDHGATVEAMMAANRLSNPDILHVGQVLILPGVNGELPDPTLAPVVAPAVIASDALTEPVIAPRGTITERMTSLAKAAKPGSPYYGTTWLTYYGRPTIGVMGILGEFGIEDLTPRLRAEAAAYNLANGDALTVTPAFHLVYGMATKATGEDNSHLAFMPDEEVMAYIEAAKAEGWAVILDVQIGALSPTEAITPALRFLEHPNVHLAIDPEFAMVHEGQAWPGNPIGYVTAEQVNQVQAVINTYLAAKQLPGPRILLVHQFQSSMIVDKEKLDTSSFADRVALTLSVDGWGGPWGKISKYNSLVTPESPFTAFKLFYRWDEPLLTPDEALGNRAYDGADFAIDITPNLIIYQ